VTAADDTANDPASTDPATWLDRYGDVLYRHALLRVHHREMAEDIVQETLLAALKARENFSGRSSEQTWLLGILRKKVVDCFRRETRRREEDPEIVGLSEFFAKNRRWKTNLEKWPTDPEKTLEDREFWRIFELCRSKLPSTLASAFVLQEIEQLGREKICEVLNISRSNLSVRLHRARLLLRRCLERLWFLAEE
jgi:RNA polymerase sigma-70 factor (ECF subfamily)